MGRNDGAHQRIRIQEHGIAAAVQRQQIGAVRQSGKPVAAAQEFKAGRRGGISAAADIVIVVKILLAGVPGRFGNAGAEIKFPFPGFRIADNGRRQRYLAAVFFHNFNGLQQLLGRIVPILVLPVKGHVVGLFGFGQHHGIDIGDHAAAALHSNAFDALAGGGGIHVLALLDLQTIQAKKQHAEHGHHRHQENNKSGVQLAVLSPFLPGFAKRFAHSSSPPSSRRLRRYMPSIQRQGPIRISARTTV